MITWFTGNSGAGKTTLSNKMADVRTIKIDGDEARYWWQDLDMSEAGRREQSLRIARLALSLDKQGFNVNVAVICPYDDLRAKVKELCGCTFIYLPYGRLPSEEYPYEIPDDSDIIYYRKGETDVDKG